MMRRWRFAVVSLVVLPTPGCFDSCTFDERDLSARIDGATSVAFHVSIPGDAVGSVSSGEYEARLTNLDTERDCAAAFYRYSEPPERDSVAPAPASEAAEERLPEGAERRAWLSLPAAREHSFVVTTPRGDDGFGIAIGSADHGDAPSLDEWIVIAVCDGADVDLELATALQLCNRGRHAPGQVAEVTRVW